MSPARAALAVDIFTGAVIISVAIALAGLSWRLLGYPGTSAPATVGGGHVVPEKPDIGPLLSLAPFGRVSAAQAPATGLGVLLRGIVLAQPRAASTALIAEGGGTPRPYSVGQTLAGGAVIEEIAVDHVLLRVHGRIETLAFPKAGVTPSPAPAAPAPVLIARPPSLLEGIGASPSEAGYVVGNPSAAMRRAGLQPGDMIEKINGTRVGNPERDRALLGSAALAETARVEVLRAGKRITLSVPLR